MLPRERSAAARRARWAASTVARSPTTASCSRHRSMSSESLDRYEAFQAACLPGERRGPPRGAAHVQESLRWAVDTVAGHYPTEGARRERGDGGAPGAAGRAGSVPGGAREAGESELDLHAADISSRRRHSDRISSSIRPPRRTSRACSRSQTSGACRGRGVRGRLEPGGARDPDARRSSASTSRGWTGSSRSSRRPDRHRSGGGYADRARARRRRAGLFFPVDPGADHARGHGRDERGPGDDDPLREDARQRAGARGGARRRGDRPHRQPRRRRPRRATT